MPFEEDERDPTVWFLDHNYVESMNDMFKKVNAREKLIGWYHSGPKLRGSDLEINELFKRYTPNPLLVIIDVQPKEAGVPTDAYFAVEEIKDVGLPLPHLKDVGCDRSDTRRKDTNCEIANNLGRHRHVKNICTYPIHHRGRGGRRDWCRALTKRYTRRCCGNFVSSNQCSTTIFTGHALPTSRHWFISTKSHGPRTTRQPHHSRTSTRCFQPTT